MLREIYDGRPGCINAAVKAFGLNRMTIHRRARRLGLTRRASSLHWTPAQLAVVEEYAGEKPVSWIAKRAGRSEAAVRAKCFDLGVSRTVRTGYTRDALSLCFGVSGETVTRWVESGKLRAPGWKTGAPWKVSENEVLRFIRHNPLAFRLNRVDQTWFLDLVLGIRGEKVA